MNRLDFDGLNAALLPNLPSLLPGWIPGGKLIGREYMAGSISGGPGDSFRFNVSKGIGQDFASDDKYGDAIALYAGVKRMSMGEAAKELAAQIGFNLSPNGNHINSVTSNTSKSLEIKPEKPPVGTPEPTMTHPRYGAPSMSWCYRDADGNSLFYVARYETESGKQLCPWSWMGGRWAAKGWSEPRPLYGLEVLKAMPEAPVVIVEGEKAADAARIIIGNKYAVVTWPNGSKAVDKADWSPLKGRSVLIWPDADLPGIEAAQKIAGIPGYKSVKIISTEGHPEKWDAADAAAEGWDFRKFVEWVKPRMQVPSVQVNVTNVTINNNVEQDEQPEQSISVHAIYDEIGLQLDKNGHPPCNIDTLMRIFNGYKPFFGKFWFDEFHQRVFTTWKSESKRAWSDVDTLSLTHFLQEKLGMGKLSDETVFKSILLHANNNKRNDPKDWMESLVWDKSPRISDFFTNCMGAKMGAYTSAASTNFWIGMAARIYRPGCQLDNMIVLEGAQGIGKTQALKRIGGEWYANASESVQDKDFFLALQGKLLIEIAELDSFGKAEVTRIKQTISNSTDHYRTPYGRITEDHPRMSVFIGTTNEKAYLKDSTGGRRFWPILCGKVDLRRIEAEREQLFAECVFRFKAGEEWYLMPKSETQEEQEDRRQVDEWENLIREYLIGKDSVSISEIGTFLDLGKRDLSIPEQSRITKCLRICGWTKTKNGWISHRAPLPTQPDLQADPY